MRPQWRGPLLPKPLGMAHVLGLPDPVRWEGISVVLLQVLRPTFRAAGVVNEVRVNRSLCVDRACPEAS